MSDRRGPPRLVGYEGEGKEYSVSMSGAYRVGAGSTRKILSEH